MTGKNNNATVDSLHSKKKSPGFSELVKLHQAKKTGEKQVSELMPKSLPRVNKNTG